MQADNLLDWITKHGRIDGNVMLQFDQAPFWIEILEDTHDDISCLCSRQTYKSTTAGRILGYYSTTIPKSVCSYIVDDEGRKAKFSEKRLRMDLFESNPGLVNYLPYGKRANINRVKLTNGSVIQIETDHGGYKHIEGSANTVLIFDEIQKQEMQSISIAYQTLTQTRGRIYRFGIGGEAGSEWYRHWEQTDQRVWVYDDTSDYIDSTTGITWPLQGWRHNITRDKKGNITNTKQELKKILAGKWIPQKPQNTDYRGYEIKQSMFPTIPLTISEARESFHEHPKRSYEFRKKSDPQSIFIPHVEGGFYKSSRRPITPDMVMACYDNTISLLSPVEIREIKNKHRNEINIYLGIDWGKEAGKTVGAVLIHWRKIDRWQIIHLDPRPEEDGTVSAAHFVKLFRDYLCDFCIADYGYGQSAVPLMQRGGSDVNGNPVKGLGRGKMMGCYTKGTRTQEDLVLGKETDKEGVKQKGHITINKTDAMQEFVDFVGQKVEVINDNDGTDTGTEIQKEEYQSKLIIPMEKEYECDFLLNDFCDVTRKDINKDLDDDSDDPRQVAEKSFMHPPDSVMAIIYAKKCGDIHSDDKFKIHAIKLSNRNYKRYRGY